MNHVPQVSHKNLLRHYFATNEVLCLTRFPVWSVVQQNRCNQKVQRDVWANQGESRNCSELQDTTHEMPSLADLHHFSHQLSAYSPMHSCLGLRQSCGNASSLFLHVVTECSNQDCGAQWDRMQNSIPVTRTTSYPSPHSPSQTLMTSQTHWHEAPCQRRCKKWWQMAIWWRWQWRGQESTGWCSEGAFEWTAN